ncbi:ABC transporter ATP-binding protein [Lachnospiraceae bacterium]|nr:ABC transporter ATP-binding protein [Lachnospiraceae bacterium]BDF39730.1 ABC transporter ATP-binding protein [Lachnospiraceae bacterium]
MSLVEVTNISYKYPNGYLAVDDVSFSIEAGENIAIIGQNGAGKTTTVKMLNGLMKPCAGDVLIHGESTKNHTTAQIARKVGYVFQNPDDQIFNPTVYKEIEYGLKKQKLTMSECEDRIKEAASLTGMTDYLGVNPYDLPLSIRKFVTIASVIASNCDVMIFDEPTAGQDLDGLNRLSGLNRILTKSGKAIVTITHDMEFVADNYERVIVMCRKKVIADGYARDVFFQKDIMDRAMLKQPAIVRIAEGAGLQGNILDVQEMAAACRVYDFSTNKL